MVMGGQLVMKQKQSGIKQSKWRKQGSGEESSSSQELDVRFQRSLQYPDLVLQLLC